MQDLFFTLITQLKDFYKSLTPIKRVSVLGSLAVVLAAFMTIVVISSKTDYVPLLQNVSPDQASSILNVLDSKKIPYQLEDSGKTITVPQSFLPSTQMLVMSEVGTNSLSQGLELFDKQSFGTTSYEQKVKYQRALQGELMRAVNSIDSVSRSKVILALPVKKTFLEEDSEEPTASVVVELFPGKKLSDDQVRGITYLVSNAVERMSAENVSVVDSRGKVLSKKSGSSLGNSTELMEARRKIENYFQERIESILSRVVGEGRVIARVSAELSDQQVSLVEETVDPDKTAVRSISSSQDSVEGRRSNPVGVAGARANLPGANEAGQVSFNQDVKREVNTTNYEVPKTVRNIVKSAGSINRLSVAVLVDGILSNVEVDGESKEQWQPRSKEEIARFESIVKNAIGFKDGRGDSVNIESFQFMKEDFSEADRVSSEIYRQKLIRFILSWLLAGFGLILIYLFVVRPFTNWITDSFHDSIEDMLPKTIEELEELQSVDQGLPGMTSIVPVLDEPIDPEKAESEILKERIMTIMDDDKEKASNAFGLWLVRRDI